MCRGPNRSQNVTTNLVSLMHTLKKTLPFIILSTLKILTLFIIYFHVVQFKKVIDTSRNRRGTR